MEKLVTILARLAAPLISGALLVLIALAASGCGGRSTTTVDPGDAEVKKSLMTKYPELANPPPVKAKKRGKR
jgi:hypothetical protein